MSNRRGKIGDKRVVSVFGSGDPQPGEAEYQTALAVGRKLTELGYAVANGGYGGTMEASARGSKEAGGETIGVVCSLWKSSPNPYIDRVISTGNLPERLQTLIELGLSGYVVLPGATGTLAELAWAWELSCRGFLPPQPGAPGGAGARQRPIVCVGDFWRPVIDMMVAVRAASASHVAVAATPDELGRFFPGA